MSMATKAATAREQTPHAVTKAKRPEDNWFAKLRLHLANIYRLTIKELRSFRSDPIMLALVAYPSPLPSTPPPPAPRPKRPTFRLESLTKTIPTCRAALRMASRRPLSSRQCRLQRRKSTRRWMRNVSFSSLKFPRSSRRIFSPVGRLRSNRYRCYRGLPRPSMA